MKLKSVEIKNFRSIESANISCSPSCLVLVGVNEAGKSNVLKALSTLGNFQPTRDDIREASQDESPIDKAFVEFSVVLEKHDVERIVVRLESTLLQKGNHPIVILGKQSYTLSEFIGQNARGVFSVDLIKGSKQGMYYKFAPGWVLTEGWYKPSNTCPPDWVTSDGKILKNYRLIFGADYPEIPTEYLAQVEPRELLSIGSAIANYVGSNPPQVVAWQYSDNNLLPASISIEEFKSNPQMCVPLLNMFRMAGISNIAEAIDGLAGQTRN